MTLLTENAKVIATEEWLNLFPNFSVDSLEKKFSKGEILLSTSSHIASIINYSENVSRLYLVYPDSQYIDVRYISELYLMPLFEPATREEFFVMLSVGMAIIETYKISIILLTPDDFSESMSDSLQANEAFVKHFLENISLPNNYIELSPVAKFKALEQFAAFSPFNEFYSGEDKSLGIIVCGSICKELDQIPQLSYPILKLRHYPISKNLMEPIYYSCDEILVLEQVRPYIEQYLRGVMGVGTRIRGKLNYIVPDNSKITLQHILNILNL